MGKNKNTKKKRIRESQSPNGVESDVSTSAAIAKSKSPASTPVQNGSVTSTPVQSGALSNGDPSTWSKSKKKRMRNKMNKQKEAIAQKNAQKKLQMSGGIPEQQSASGGSVNNGDGDTGISGKPSTPDGNSKKRQRKNPTSVEKKVDQQKSSPKSNKKNVTEASQNSNEAANQTVAEDSSPKKKGKKKKKNSKAQTAASEESQKSPSKSNENQPGTKSKEADAKSNNDTSPKPTSPKLKISLPKQTQMSTLQKAFLERLTSSRFRELNEELYTHSSDHSFDYFTQNPELFDQYHVGFRKQAKEWPVNPVDVIYKKIVKDYSAIRKKKEEEKGEKGDKQEGKQVVVADFGCGDAKLAERLLALQLGNDGKALAHAGSKKKKKSSAKDKQQPCPFKVHSFDLVSGGNALVTPADMCNVPLPKEAVDVGVYSLALMGTNVADFVREAWRVLKFNGVLRVAEVRSRFETAAAVDETKGGGKRGKLNNGKKNSKKPHHPNNKQHNSSEGDNENPHQPLMLLDEFISLMERCGFECTNMDRSNKMFLFMDFVKVDGSKGLSSKERFSAKPCIYKRR